MAEREDTETRVVHGTAYTIQEDEVLAEAEWSTVYVGRLNQNNNDQKRAGNVQLLAIKMPNSSRSKQVLVDEAQILSYLHGLSNADNYIVGFYGLDLECGATVLEKMDITVQQYVRTVLELQSDRVQALRQAFPTIATRLISCLAWLHQVGQVVHGDIKPSNILLQRHVGTPQKNKPIAEEFFPFKPVLADFGSSRRISDLRQSKCGNTREFMSPENMSSAASETPPTLEADVWAMGISLLTVITGRTPYPRLSWPAMFSILREGDPITHEENSSSTIRERIAASGDLVNILRPALKKDPKRRVTAVEWSIKLADSVAVEP
jgi:serine/threonine protein kinase